MINKSVIDLIKQRVSTRTFKDQQIAADTKEKFVEYLNKINNEITIKARFGLIDVELNAQEPVKLGTYGIISGAKVFLFGIMNKDENDAIEFGYQFEKIVLFATALGLQTCWMGGTFKRNDFIKSAKLKEDEYIAMISPLGYQAEKRRAVESIMRSFANSDYRKPWEQLFFNSKITYPLSQESAGDYLLPLQMVRLGPSASNMQPWRVIKEDNLFHFFLSRKKGYHKLKFDMQKNDLGIVKCHFELSALELGLIGSWQILEKVESPAEWEYVFSWVAQIEAK